MTSCCGWEPATVNTTCGCFVKEFNPSTDVLTDDNATFVKSSAKAEGECAPVNYTWTKGSIETGDKWYLRAYLVYAFNGELHIVYGSLYEFAE